MTHAFGSCANEEKLLPTNEFKQEAAMERLTIPTLEELRTVSWDRSDAPGMGLFGFAGRDIRSRSFNLLRTQLTRLAETKGWKSFGVVSAAPGAGKSFVSANLAAAMSLTPGRQVYLFDFDLRRPSVARNFGFSPEIGLERFLSGDTASLTDIGYRLDEERLAIFPSAPTSLPSAELLTGVPMTQMMTAMHQLPDQLFRICDLPPAFANDDAALVAKHLDAYLLVVEQGRTTAKQIRDTMEFLEPTPCAGTVLNRYVGGIAGGDYGFGYSQSSYSGYFDQLGE